MARHLTVRMAWHDNNWDGTICQNPEKNDYCVGSHSLLSDRIARNRNLTLEMENRGKKLDELENYLPPCYWSSNAFSDQSFNVWHEHPFENYSQDHSIKDKLSGYSVFTWPFRLSFNHNKGKINAYGKYAPDLEGRIDRFIEKFSKSESLVFFYLNYDNPISADENKYVLVGCATLSDMKTGKQFDFNKEELDRIKSGSGMQYFPTMNWAITISYDFLNSGIVLPYKEYLDFVEGNPKSAHLLDEMRVIITEEELIPDFKYVATDINDDSCIYLLSKLRKSLVKIKEHGIVDVKKTQNQIDTVDKLLGRAWKSRGIYPSLGKILDVIINLEPEGYGKGDEIVKLIKNNSENNDLLERTFEIMKNQNIPSFLKEYESIIQDISINLQSYQQNILEKLSLFSLTQKQIQNILSRANSSFKKKIEHAEIIDNPYILCEKYVSEEPNLADEEISDYKIGLFSIDAGMFPDSSYLKRNMVLQNLPPASPKRLRAVIIDYLLSLESSGNCYSPLNDIYQNILNHPLFYKDKINIDENNLASDPAYLKNFKERLIIIENKQDHYFYLKEIYEAEELVKKTFMTLFERKDHKLFSKDLQKFLKDESKALTEKIPNFQKERFVKERTTLVSKALKKSLYVISGKPGSGKTNALSKIIQEIQDNGENITILAPTGKAVLRLREVTGQRETKTIDSFLYKQGCKKMLDDFENFSSGFQSNDHWVQNLVIDESSMLDLKHLAILFKILTGDNGKLWTKRIILIGDENQLPPIGYGKPFFDIIEFMKNNQKYRDEHFIELQTNCRQEYDEDILKVAEIFRGGYKYYEDILDRITSGQFASKGFKVELWENDDELTEKLSSAVSNIIKTDLKENTPQKKSAQLNLLFGLKEDGSVPDGLTSKLDLNKLQLLTPYRSSYFGTLGLNKKIKSEFRTQHPLDLKITAGLPFTHSDKIIRLTNMYGSNYAERNNTIELSNGSIGVINNIQTNGWPKKIGYFTDQPNPISKLGESDNYELAYAITVHKSQGSEFEHIIVVIPQKSSLLSRELIYTALTRSTRKVTLFLQKSENGSILNSARLRSDILRRMTSIFEMPQDYRKIYEPKFGVEVRSKVEYILFNELEKRGLDFYYEKQTEFKKDANTIILKPDFTIHVGQKKYYLEHLGMLDIQEYSQQWQERKTLYEENGMDANLLTTDDLDGIKQEKISKLLDDIMNGVLEETLDCKFSKHHYQLY